MFAGFLGLTILGDCVSAGSMQMGQLSRSRSYAAWNSLPAQSFVTTDSQLQTPSLSCFPSDFWRARQRLEGPVYDLA